MKWRKKRDQEEALEEAHRALERANGQANEVANKKTEIQPELRRLKANLAENGIMEAVFNSLRGAS